MCVKVYVPVHTTCVNATGVLFCVRTKLNGRRLYRSIFSGVCTLQYATDHKLLLCPQRAILVVYGMDVSTLPKHQILSAIHVNLTIYSEPSVRKVRYHSTSRCSYLSSIYVEFATYKVHITDVCIEPNAPFLNGEGHICFVWLVILNFPLAIGYTKPE